MAEQLSYKLHSFLRVCKDLSTYHSPHSAEIRLLRECEKLIPSHAILIFYREGQGGNHFTARSLNNGHTTETDIRISKNDPAVSRCFSERISLSRISPEHPILSFIKAELLVPLSSVEEVFGFLYFARSRENEFTDEEIQTAEHAACFLALMLERNYWRLKSKKRRHDRKKQVQVKRKSSANQETVTDALEAALWSALDYNRLDQSVHRAAQAIHDIIPFDYFSVTLFSSQGGESHRLELGTDAVHERFKTDFEWQPIKGSPFGWLVRTHRHSEQQEGLAFSMPVHKSFMLLHGESYTGNWAVARTAHKAFSDKDISVFKSLSSKLAFLFENSRQFESRDVTARQLKQAVRLNVQVNKDNPESSTRRIEMQLVNKLMIRHAQFLVILNEHIDLSVFRFLPEYFRKALSQAKCCVGLTATREIMHIETPLQLVDMFCKGHPEKLTGFKPFSLIPITNENDRITILVLVWHSYRDMAEFAAPLCDAIQLKIQNAFR